EDGIREDLVTGVQTCALPIFPYGDEIGKTNIPLDKLPPQLRKDTRNINRGKITAEELNSAKGKRIMEKLSKIIVKRQALREFLRSEERRVGKEDSWGLLLEAW